ncbi:alpha/beta fold hydrolase [Cellulomonas cellasea]|uniref:Pimeloyl-ACP methyl ester carboxylesterase n=1 Tax=Cellulomonas cellasea TaxID=43670 RepID=A0A7W4UFZ6_9CELL|nr:alpha/beta hydrolase [Cellulomonas cellasea]MBB2923488.1 pimeloyl-ACP methyl ester carboxylesterase [Cellulomonas cellasea]
MDTAPHPAEAQPLAGPADAAPDRVEGTARSADGTVIAWDRTGAGPPVVLVEPALHDRSFSAFDGLAPLLAPHLTVVRYDRRGRGASTGTGRDAGPDAVEREVEDLAAVLDAVGGPALLHGFSSGALLALHAAVRGLDVAALVLVEPPLGDDDPDERARSVDFTAELAALVAAGRDADAVDRFHEGIGVPPEALAQTPPDVRATFERLAPTLVHDCRLGDGTTLDTLRAVRVPALVVDSAGSSPDLTGWAARAAAALPRGTRRSLPGTWHGVADDALAAAVLDVAREHLLPGHGPAAGPGASGGRHPSG